MKIHILTKMFDGAYGGGNQFAKALRETLRQKESSIEKVDLNLRIRLFDVKPSMSLWVD